MAWGLKYQGDMSDKSGVEFKVEIFEKDYTGIVKSMQMATSSPVVVSQNQSGKIIGSKCDIKVHTRYYGQYSQLFFSEEGKYKMILTHPKITWVGIVVPGIYSEDFDNYPSVTTISAVDGLGRLKDIFIDADAPGMEGKELIKIISEGIRKATAINLLYINNAFYLVDKEFYEVRATEYLIYDKNGKKRPLYDILQEYLKTFDMIMVQKNGIWFMSGSHFIYEGMGALIYDCNTDQFINGTYIPGSTRLFSVADKVLTGGTISIQPPLSNIELTWKRKSYNNHLESILFNPRLINLISWFFTSIQYNAYGNTTSQPNYISQVIPGYGGVNSNTRQEITASGNFGTSAHAGKRFYFNLKNESFFAEQKDGFKLTIDLEYIPRKLNIVNQWLEANYDSVKVRGSVNVRLTNAAGQLYVYGSKPNPNNYAEYLEPRWYTGNELSGININTELMIGKIDGTSSTKKLDIVQSLKLVKDISLPDDGEIEVYIRDLYTESEELQELDELYLYAVNVDYSYEGKNEYEETIVYNTNDYGYVESEKIDIELANKLEILADGNLFMDHTHNALPFNYNGINGKIQDLLIYKIANHRNKRREQLNLRIKDIVPPLSILTNVPPTNNAKKYGMVILSSVDVRNGETTGTFLEMNNTYIPIPVEVYSKDRLIETKTIG